MLLTQMKSLKIERKLICLWVEHSKIDVCRLTSVGRTFLQGLSYKDCPHREPATLSPLGGLRGWVPNPQPRAFLDWAGGDCVKWPLGFYYTAILKLTLVVYFVPGVLIEDLLWLISLNLTMPLWGREILFSTIFLFNSQQNYSQNASALCFNLTFSSPLLLLL